MLCGLQQFSLSLRNLLLPTILVLQSAKDRTSGQVKAARPTLDCDGRYGAPDSLWTRQR